MTKQSWLFALAVAFQLVILAAIPAKQIQARWTGTLITIKTAPVDPYDFLSGYHVILRYEISRPSDEHWSSFPSERKDGMTVYAILQKGADDIWTLRTLTDKRPKELPEDQIALKGRISHNTIEYGIEHFFIPEEGRDTFEAALRRNQQTALAQIRVDRFGHAALIRLIVDGKTYEY